MNYQSKTTTNKKTIPVKVAKTAAQIELEEMVAQQLTDRRYAPVRHEELTKSVTYVTAKNGLFKVTKTDIGLFKELLQEFTDEISGIPAMEPGVDLVIPKIPMKHLVDALSFYRDVNTKDRAEASVLFFWNTHDKVLPELTGLSNDGKLVIYCPKQENSAALSNFTADENVKWLRDNLSLLLETHSHNTMDAFFSGTDDANENMTQFYGVWGRVTSKEPAFAFRYVVGNSKIECSPDMLIDWPTVEETQTIVTKRQLRVTGDSSLIDLEIEDGVSENEKEEVVVKHHAIKGPFKMTEYPEDWMGQHSKPVYKYTPRNTYYGKKQKNFGGSAGVQTDLWDDYGYGQDPYDYNYARDFSDHYPRETEVVDLTKK